MASTGFGSPLAPQEQGGLTLRQISATFDKDFQKIGKQEPFLVFALGDARTETSVIKGQQVHWNEDYHLRPSPGSLRSDPLKIYAFNKHRVLPDTNLGAGQLPLESVEVGGLTTVPLTKNGQHVGDVTFMLLEMRTSVSPQDVAASPAAAMAPLAAGAGLGAAAATTVHVARPTTPPREAPMPATTDVLPFKDSERLSAMERGSGFTGPAPVTSRPHGALREQPAGQLGSAALADTGVATQAAAAAHNAGLGSQDPRQDPALNTPGGGSAALAVSGVAKDVADSAAFGDALTHVEPSTPPTPANSGVSGVGVQSLDAPVLSGLTDTKVSQGGAPLSSSDATPRSLDTTGFLSGSQDIDSHLEGKPHGAMPAFAAASTFPSLADSKSDAQGAAPFTASEADVGYKGALAPILAEDEAQGEQGQGRGIVQTVKNTAAGATQAVTDTAVGATEAVKGTLGYGASQESAATSETYDREVTTETTDQGRGVVQTVKETAAVATQAVVNTAAGATEAVKSTLGYGTGQEETAYGTEQERTADTNQGTIKQEGAAPYLVSDTTPAEKQGVAQVMEPRHDSFSAPDNQTALGGSYSGFQGREADALLSAGAGTGATWEYTPNKDFRGTLVDTELDTLGQQDRAANELLAKRDGGTERDPLGILSAGETGQAGPQGEQQGRTMVQSVKDTAADAAHAVKNTLGLEGADYGTGGAKDASAFSGPIDRDYTSQQGRYSNTTDTTTEMKTRSDDASNYAQDTAVSAKQTAQDAAADARDMAVSAKHTVQDTAADASNYVKDSARSAKQTADDTAGWAAQKTQDTTDYTKDTAQDTFTTSRDTTEGPASTEGRSYLQMVRDMAAGATAAVKNTLSAPSTPTGRGGEGFPEDRAVRDVGSAGFTESDTDLNALLRKSGDLPQVYAGQRSASDTGLAANTGLAEDQGVYDIGGGAPAVGAYGGAAGTGTSTTENVKETAATGTDAAANKAGSAMNTAKDTAAGATQYVTETAPVVAQSAKETAAGAAQYVAETAPVVAESAKVTAAGAAQYVADTAPGAIQAAKETAAAAAGYVQEKVGQTVEAAKQTTADTELAGEKSSGDSTGPDYITTRNTLINANPNATHEEIDTAAQLKVEREAGADPTLAPAGPIMTTGDLTGTEESEALLAAGAGVVAADEVEMAHRKHQSEDLGSGLEASRELEQPIPENKSFDASRGVGAVPSTVGAAAAAAGVGSGAGEAVETESEVSESDSQKGRSIFQVVRDTVVGAKEGAVWGKNGPNEEFRGQDSRSTVGYIKDVVFGTAEGAAEALLNHPGPVLKSHPVSQGSQGSSTSGLGGGVEETSVTGGLTTGSHPHAD